MHNLIEHNYFYLIKTIVNNFLYTTVKNCQQKWLPLRAQNLNTKSEHIQFLLLYNYYYYLSKFNKCGMFYLNI